MFDDALPGKKEGGAMRGSEGSAGPSGAKSDGSFDDDDDDQTFKDFVPGELKVSSVFLKKFIILH